MFLYISHPKCKLHDNGWGHPENSQRTARIEDQLIAQRLFDFMLTKEARKAEVADVVRVHTEHYWNVLLRNLPEEGVVRIDDDTVLSPGSLEAALYASGAVLDAVDAVMENRASGVFCNVRPPGHHAEVHQPMGFCIVNNIAIGAAYALDKFGLQRVAILDIDVHHGNGTDSYIHQEPKASLISSFEEGLYPFTPLESDVANLLKLGLKAGDGSAEFMLLWENQAWPFLREFQPELILVSAGFDTHRADPLAHINLREDDFAIWANSLKALLPEIGNPKVVSVLEGGYDLNALGSSAAAYIKAMAGL
ncbi:histone deacetylase family protein [Thiomicrorhabdus sp.]|uniref:histone deacetylase family protein n=1 Tax=Thiomicrorhabdus sp. TaxID=2039724 RepID=UPI0029C6863C|nr:histone deacetylase family protein [Thiomicrorhabdus sp.]